MKELLTKGANIDVQSDTGHSSLHLASQKGHTEVVKELLTNGCSNQHWAFCSTCCQSGWTYGNSERTSNKGNVQSDTWHSSLHLASQKGHTDVGKELLTKGANIDIQTNTGHSSLHDACEKGHTEVVKELI